MADILYNRFSLSNNIFKYFCKDDSFIKEVPVIKQAIYFLDKLSEVNELKATRLGNLPKNFVIDFYYMFLSKERFANLPNKEEDLFQLTRLKIILEFSGLIKIRNKKFSLTNKGKDILNNNDLKLLFEEIFLTCVNKYNWAYDDRYSELKLIQSSVIFNFYLINKLCHNWIEENEIGANYFKAFPDLVFECINILGEPDKHIINCFSTRFLQRFCLPLGFLEIKTDGENYLNRKTYYKITPFFINSIHFNVR